MNTSTTPAPMVTTWWYAKNQQKFGPYTEAELHNLARSGDVLADDLVWNSHLDNWVAASSIGSLVFGTPVAQSAISAPVEALEDPTQNTPHEPEAQAPTPEAIQQKQLSHFVGSKREFYLRHWEKEDHFFSWNWAAFWLGLFWLAYRKMYWACALLVGVVVLALGTALQLKIPIETVQQWQSYFVISFSMTLGLFGNRLYLLHAKHKIRKITEQHAPEDALREIEKQGGGSIRAVLHVITAILLCSMVLGALFGQQ